MDYTDKTALVTGGASGIGRATAIAFAREGANVAVADRNRADGEAVVKQIVAFGGRAIFIETDVTSEAAIASMVERTVAEFGGLDTAFNNAAGSPGAYSTAATCTTQEWESLIRINMASVWLCMKYEIPEMLKRVGRPEEIADTVLWLCSDRSSYVTGLAINVDGGNMACCT